MRYQTCLKSCLVVILFCGVAWTTSGLVAETAQDTQEDQQIRKAIESEQERVLSHLESRLLRNHEILSQANVDLDEKTVRQKLTGGRDFWNETFHEVYWQRAITDRQDSRGFQLLVNLEQPQVVVPGKSDNSTTMAATQLLNHVFGDLNKLGYRSSGSPAGIVSGIQYASNRWTLEQKHGARIDRVTITGEVFFAPRDQQAIIMGTVHYRIGQ